MIHLIKYRMVEPVKAMNDRRAGSRDRHGSMLAAIRGRFFACLLALVSAATSVCAASATDGATGTRDGADRERAHALCLTATQLIEEGEAQQAYESFDEAQRIYEAIDATADRAKVLSDMGKIQTDLSQYPIAMDHLLNALGLFETVGDSQSQMLVLNRLAIVHLELSEIDKALQRFDQALTLARNSGNNERAAAILGNMGIVHARRGDHLKAIEFYTRSIEVPGADQDPRKIAIFQNNIAVQYARQGDFESALDHYLQALPLLEEVGDQQLLGEGYNNTGEAYLLLGRLREAEESMMKGLRAAERSGEKVTQQDCYLNLTSLHEARGDFDKALRSHQRYAELREEIFSEAKAAQIAELEAAHETRKKEDEINRLKVEADFQDVQLEKHLQVRYLLILSVILLLVILAILVIGYRRKVATQRLLREKNEQLDHIAQRLKRTDQLRRELVSNLTHDLRSPLAVLHGYLESLLLKDDQFSPAERRKHLEVALAASSRVQRLVSDLFDLSLLETRPEDVQREPFSISDLVSDAAQQYGLLAGEKGVEIQLDIDSATPMVQADIGLMERVLHNLLSNAVRYTTQGNGIEVRVQPDGDGVGISIANSGPGISAEEIPLLFDRYYTANGDHDGDNGSGLGLAIVKKILDLHDIEINVSGAPGEYVSFCFRLPYADPPRLQSH